jgi:uncharacterized protein YjcR
VEERGGSYVAGKASVDVLTLDEVAEKLQVSVRTLRSWRSRGILTITYLGGSQKYPRVTEADLEKFITDSRAEKWRRRKGQERRQQCTRVT